MRLSDAILLGVPEIHFTNEYWFEREPNGSCQGCLVGAALYSRGFGGDKYPTNKLMEYWPWIKEIEPDQLRCPICAGENVHLLECLTDLANHYLRKQVSVEEIADFIRSIEPAEEEAPAAAEQGRGVLVAK